MSEDLDADLYADLYGEEDPNEPRTEKTEKPASTAKPAAAATVQTPATPVSAKEVKAAEPSTVTTDPRQNKPAPVPAPATPVQATPTYTPPASVPVAKMAPTPTQPIPTPLQNSQPIAVAPLTSTAPVASYGNRAYQTGAPIPTGQQYEHRGVRPSEMKEEGKMFIGGLNWDTTDEGLSEYFSQFGRVEACTIMRDPTGRSRCFAFLTFEDPASVNAVMVREHVLDGKIIDPKRAIPRQEHSRATKLFIGGLPPTVTSDSMREFFGQHGKVVDSTVMVDRETGRSKGFGFITFEDTNVEPILGFGKLEIDGKLIDVKLAQPRGARTDATVYGQSGGAQQNDYSGGVVAGGDAGAAANVQSAMAGAAAGMGGAGFDPQALAGLYQRMFSHIQGMGMNPMMGGMNPMMGGMNPMMGGMNPAMMGGMSGGMGRGGMGMGMGRGAGGDEAGGHMGANQNIPRGPRAAGGQGGHQGPPTGPGPQRTSRGQGGYHPYSR